MITHSPSRVRATGRVRSARLQGAGGRGARRVVSESWERSLLANVDPDHAGAPAVYSRDDLEQARAQHPLGSIVSLLEGTLRSVTDDGSHVMIVTDADGDVLWRAGSSSALRRSDSVGLVEGSRWAENVVGTNGMGTALATRAPVQIYATEHLVHRFDAWTCAAAPIHDPATGQVLGTVDLSGSLRCVHPATLALVVAAARLAETEMLRVQKTRTNTAADPLELSLLGPGAPRARLGPRTVHLTSRQADLLAVMTLRPEGLSADELATAVYGEYGRVGTVRTQIHRLRAALGPGSISTSPYRLRIPTRTDFLAVRDALTAGQIRDAARLYRGPLLPVSEAPAIREERTWLAAAVRRAVLTDGDLNAMWSFVQSRDGADDYEVLDLLSRRLPPRDPRQALLNSTLAGRHADVG